MPVSTSKPTGPRVAVIGSGLAGLTTAYLLRLKGVTVYLIEKSDKLGFHSSSIDVPLETTPRDGTGNGNRGRDHKPSGSGSKDTWAVDVPMRSFQGGYYENLIALYRHLGISLRPTYFTFSFSHPSPISACETDRNGSTLDRSSDKARPARTPGSRSEYRPYFIHSGASGQSIPALPSRAFHSPWALLVGAGRLIAYAGCYLLLLALAAMSYHSLLPSLFSGTLGDTVNQIALFLYHPIPYLPIYTPLGLVWRSFIHSIVIPLFSSVMTTPESDVYSTPVKHILEYVHRTVGVDHYTLAPGFSARSIANNLAEAVRDQGDGYLKLGTTITDLRYVGGRVMIDIEEEEGLEVDRVVLATPASVARVFLGMLERSMETTEGEGEMRSQSEDEAVRIGVMKKALSQVRYKETIVVTHRDSTLLPSSRSDIRDINLVHPFIKIERRGNHTLRKDEMSGSESQTAETTATTTPHFDPDQGYTMATHVIRLPDGSAVYQTTNPMVPIREDRVLGIARLERALPLRNPFKTIRALHPSHGVVYLAGAYAWSGIPLLEGCIGSAKRVVNSITTDFNQGSSIDSDQTRLRPRKKGMGGEGELEMEVDWSKGRGGLVGRIWRWRRTEEID